MIYYPLSILMLAGIRDILIITTKKDAPAYEQLLGDGAHLGISIQYEIQALPNGLAEAFLPAERFIDNQPVALILGDNLFYGAHLFETIKRLAKQTEGCHIFSCHVENPSEYGVVEMDSTGKAISIEEKPMFPKSSYAIGGLYFFDKCVVEIAKTVQPSLCGELEITSILEVYLKRNQLHVHRLERGVAWHDLGTHRSLLKASNFVETIQERHGLFIACIEEIAYQLGYISKDELRQLAVAYKNSDYGRYLIELAHTHPLRNKKELTV